jgi:4-hydroxy-3-polyprenylbenzoate decarboxylase
MRLIIGMSGASGAIYGIRLLEILKEIPDVETHLVMSPSAKLNIKVECEQYLDSISSLADEVHNFRNIGATIASGSFRTAGMIVTPCSMKTLSGVVNSYADNLLLRAADVVLKEHRRLVVAPRETPLHTGHCRLLYEASKLGIIIAPPMPAMYNCPKAIDDIVNHTVGRLLDLFDIDSDVMKRWQGLGGNEAEPA